MLSCRIQNKCIEQAFFHYLFERHNPQGVAGLWVNFRHTERNKPARQVMEALGFQNCANTSAPFPEGMVHFLGGHAATAMWWKFAGLPTIRKSCPFRGHRRTIQDWRSNKARAAPRNNE